MSLKTNYESQSCCKEQQKDVGWHFLKKLTTLQNLRDVFKQHSIQEIYQLYIKLGGAGFDTNHTFVRNQTFARNSENI